MHAHKDQGCATGDVRTTVEFREAQALTELIRCPGSGQISDAGEIHASPDGRHAVIAGAMCESLEGMPPTRICEVDLSCGELSVLTFGPNSDRSPRFSPDGVNIAFLSDRRERGRFQLYIYDRSACSARSAGSVDGSIEYLAWSPDGNRILLGVAGRGADLAGAQGAVGGSASIENAPSWTPHVLPDLRRERWRGAYIYDRRSGTTNPVRVSNGNVWEASWCGDEAIALLVSEGPEETDWYSAEVVVLPVDAGEEIYRLTPPNQVGLPVGAPSGKHLAVISSLASDRSVVAGEVLLVDLVSKNEVGLPIAGFDVSHLEWRSDTHLLLAGHRQEQSVVALFDLRTRKLTEVWGSAQVSTGGRYFTVSGIGSLGDCVFVGEGFDRAPEIGLVSAGTYRAARSFDLGYGKEVAAALSKMEYLRWTASDGLEIGGWLLLPSGSAPFPLLVDLHGGPVWLWRPRWLGRGSMYTLMLLRRGYAVFLPNPRGSVGQGASFTQAVLGDLGGRDAEDVLRGIDHLANHGIIDRKRIAVTGVSYGGYLSACLIAQDPRFAAAVLVSPMSNLVTEYLLSNIADFVRIFLRGDYVDQGEVYQERSPLTHARAVKTPTLTVCGAFDRCTPPTEGAQFHAALQANGTESVLVTYPQEGHGVRNWPSAFDFSARATQWFETHLRKPTVVAAPGSP